MKRTLIVLSVLVFCMVAARAVSAQSDPRIGTWKLNVEKSKGNTRTSETRTYMQSGDGVTVSVEYMNRDGSKHSYGMTETPDGKDYPFNGEGPGGAETISVKQVGSVFAAEGKKGGKLLFKTKVTFSDDGKVMTLATKGSDANGHPFDNVRVYDKQ